MASLTRLFKCDNCNDGVVRLTAKSSKGQISIAVKNCDVCNKSFGVKSLNKLKEVVLTEKGKEATNEI